MSDLEPVEEGRDVMALSGLRRLVVHAREQLRVTRLRVPNAWAYGKEWSPALIRAYAAQDLAQQVLTLVADCLPASGALSADEVATLRREQEEEGIRWAKQLAETRAKIADLEGDVASLVEERDAAVEDQAAAEQLETEMREKLEEAQRLARTNVPKAMKLLLGEEPGL